MQIFQIWAPTVLVNAAASASGIVGDDRCYEAWTGAATREVILHPKRA